MFGRSGQMFPRQRAYHDAIYEEEYGSETEEDCCRGRGLSAILCWFLSVIVLIGLAASVVLTVFFVLKGRAVLVKNNQEDLNFVLDHGNGFKLPATPTTSDHNLNFTSSKVPIDSASEEVPVTTTFLESIRTSATLTTTSTRVPPTTRLTTRKYWSDTTGGPLNDYTQRTTSMPPTTESGSVFKFLFNTIQTFQKDDSTKGNNFRESFEQAPIDEVISNESVESYVPHPAPTTTGTTSTTTTTTATTSTPTHSSRFPTTSRTMTSTSPVLFTLPPSTSTVSHRKSGTTTRFPERTSFSAEDTSATNYQGYDHGKHFIPPSSSEETGATSELGGSTVKPGSGYRDSGESTEETLNKMLIDQIPPHRDGSDESSTTTTSSPTTVITEDLLAKIIKNLQPKWNKSKTDSSLSTPTGSSGSSSKTRNRYVELDRGSVENKNGDHVKVRRVKVRVTTTLPPTTVIFITPEKADTTFPSTVPTTYSHNADSSEHVTNIQRGPTISPNKGLELIEGPNLGSSRKENKKEKDNKKESNEFLDILVGADDQKSLVTKETDSGIITSAILPPWYDTNSNSTDTLELSNHTLKFTKTEILNDDDDDDSKNDHSKPKTDIDILLNLFSNSPLPKQGNNDKSHYPKSETYIPEPSAEESRKASHLKNLEDQLKPFFSSPSDDEESDAPAPLTGAQRVSPANNAFHYGSSDGSTHIYGYYPDEDLDEGDQVDIEISGNENRRHSNESQDDKEELLNGSGSSHVIDIAYDPKAQPEIVIEPDTGDGDADDDYTENENDNYSGIIEPMAAGSDIQNHEVYVPPPKNMLEQQQKQQPSSNGKGTPAPQGSLPGSGIRRPVASNEDTADLYTAANEPKVEQAADWSMKHAADKPEEEEQENIPGRDDLTAPEYELSEELLEEEDEKNFHTAPENEKNPSPSALSSEDSSNVEDHVIERKPILHVDQQLYSDKNQSASNVTTTSTAKPKVRVYEVYAEPFRTTAAPEPSTTEQPELPAESQEVPKNKSGFVPPKPINFHESSFNLHDTQSDFVSRDGWRPVVYDRQGGNKERTRPQPNNKRPMNVDSSEQSYFLSSSMQPPPFSAGPALQITTPVRSPVTTPSNNNGRPKAPEEYEDEEGNPTSSENWYSEQEGGNDSRGSETKLKIKPSMQIPMPATNPPPQPARVKFPGNDIRQQQQRQQQQQYQSSVQQNHIIDRTKYAHRPVPPPILMRRKPQFNLPFQRPNRTPIRTKTKVNGIPNRNFPRGPYPAAPGPGPGPTGASGPGPGPYPPGPENGNPPNGLRHRNHVNNNNNNGNPNQPQGTIQPPGTVHWPAESNFIRRHIPPPQHPPQHMNRRPMG